MSQQPDAQFVDIGNKFIGPDYPAELVTGKIQTPAGERFLMTVRCGPATVTVTMPQAAAKAWAARIEEEASAMSGLVIPNGVIVDKKLP